jgi:hypothetical protein
MSIRSYTARFLLAGTVGLASAGCNTYPVEGEVALSGHKFKNTKQRDEYTQADRALTKMEAATSSFRIKYKENTQRSISIPGSDTRFDFDEVPEWKDLTENPEVFIKQGTNEQNLTVIFISKSSRPLVQHEQGLIASDGKGSYQIWIEDPRTGKTRLYKEHGDPTPSGQD